MVKTTWVPRRDSVIIRGVLKNEVVNRKVKVTDSDGNYYLDDYDWFVYDKGEDVDPYLEIGHEIYMNHANIRVFFGITDRKKEETLAYISDMLILFNRPAPTQI